MHLDDKTFTNLLIICQALDAKFPHGADIFQRVSRLCEESGELASAVNHLEGMGVKRRKHGQPQYDNLIKEIQDVMRCAVGIAVHYGVERKVVAAIARSAEGVERK